MVAPTAPDLLLTLHPGGTGFAVSLTERKAGRLLASGNGEPLPDEIDPADLSRAALTSLARSALPSDVARALRSRVERSPIRLGLHLSGTNPDLPWECLLLDWDREGPLCLDPRIHVSRLVRPTPPWPSRPRIKRVLIASADPNSPAYPRLPASKREVESVMGALRRSDFAVEHLRFATHASLDTMLREFCPDVLHFVGHGGRRPSGGTLALETGVRGSHADLYAEDLLGSLREAQTALVVLSSCDTAGLGTGFGDDLARNGVPAVVGMRLAMDDRSAHLFARTLYGGLAEGLPVVSAVAEAREALRGSATDWAAPVALVSGEDAPSREKPRHNIPADDREFVGRSVELATLTGRLADGPARLITVTGMGGMGKTRLAKRAALEAASDFADGVWLVECEALSRGNELLAALAAALAIENPLDEEALIDRLREMSALLLFDCFERITGEAGLLSEILRWCPGVKILITSRVLLNLEAEQEFELKPMSLRGRRGDLGEATALFVQAAAYSKPDFALTPKSRKLVDQIIRDLEAVPLAIVLAAGRLRQMDLQALSERVRTQRLEILRRRPIRTNDRHADIRRVVSDSLQLLFEPDRTLLRDLATFRGGFFQADAEAVLGSEVTEGLGFLRDNSLLMRADVSGGIRFRILDTVRECLEEEDGSGEVEARHAAHFGRRATDVRASFDAGEFTRAQALLWTDIGNFGRAAGWAIANGDSALIRRLAASLARVYFEAGARGEFEALTDAAMKQVDTDPELLIELHGLQGELYKREGRPDEAERHWRERAALCAMRGDIEAQADSLMDIAALSLDHDRLAVAEEALAEVERMRLPPGPVPLGAQAILAKLRLKQRRVEEALELAGTIDAELRSHEHDPALLFHRAALIEIYRGAGRTADCIRVAQALLAEGLSTGHYLSVARSLLALSRAHWAEGRLPICAKALVAASRMPDGVSGVVRKAVREFRLEFAREHCELLAQEEALAGKADWVALASMNTF
jgi:predicted ATPase